MAKTRKKLVLCYALDRRKEYSRFKLFIRVFFAEEDSVARLHDAAIDNKAGYGTPEAARSMEEWYALLLGEGITRVLDQITYGDPKRNASVTMSWSELDGWDEYGTGRSYADGDVVRLGDGHFTASMEGMRLLTRIGKRIEKTNHSRKEHVYEEDKPEAPTNRTFTSPSRFVRALESMKGRRVMRRETRYSGNWIYDTSRRMWLLSDTLLESLEMAR